jgi:hypothetical protein
MILRSARGDTAHKRQFYCVEQFRLSTAEQKTITKLFYERPKEEVITHVKEVPGIQPSLEVGQNLGDFLDGVCEHKLALLQLKHK